jgi:hypothetical protein
MSLFSFFYHTTKRQKEKSLPLHNIDAVFMGGGALDTSDLAKKYHHCLGPVDFFSSFEDYIELKGEPSWSVSSSRSVPWKSVIQKETRAGSSG